MLIPWTSQKRSMVYIPLLIRIDNKMSSFYCNSKSYLGFQIFPNSLNKIVLICFKHIKLTFSFYDSDCLAF